MSDGAPDAPPAKHAQKIAQLIKIKQAIMAEAVLQMIKTRPNTQQAQIKDYRGGLEFSHTAESDTMQPHRQWRPLFASSPDTQPLHVGWDNGCRGPYCRAGARFPLVKL